MRTTRLLALGAILGTANSCSKPAPAAWKPTIDPVTAIEATYQRYDAFLRTTKGDSIGALYTADGEMVGTAEGPAAIAAFLNGFKNVTVESTGHDTEAITVADSLAVHWGRFRQKGVAGGRPFQASGRFVIEWHHAADGRWLIRRFLTVPDPARP